MKKEFFNMYLDETGDHGLNFVDENFPIFLLTACLFNESDYAHLCDEVNAFKIKFFGTDGVILHSRDIRKCEGAFQILFDLTIKADFYKDLNRILKNADFNIFSAVLNKQDYIEKYGRTASDPYFICLTHIIETVISHLNKVHNSNLSIFIEKRGKK